MVINQGQKLAVLSVIIGFTGDRGGRIVIGDQNGKLYCFG